ncbi:MAG: hypothetical protein HQM13_14650 [SAR324 cluster bacterium]|nr:hypothetical protein [SAR324 cluster bacterium]
MSATIWGKSLDTALTSMLREKIDLRRLQKYPALIIISPQEKTIERARRLYQKLVQTSKTKSFLLISPNLPFYRTRSSILAFLENKIDDELKSGVLLDWNQGAAKFFNAANSELPIVLLLEEDGTALGRFQFELESNAFEFIANTFSALFPSNSDQLWANSTADFQFSDREIQ